jgi:hypothetical protein
MIALVDDAVGEVKDKIPFHRCLYTSDALLTILEAISRLHIDKQHSSAGQDCLLHSMVKEAEDEAMWSDSYGLSQ